MLPVTVRVPATSANLGPGFDCLGLALDLCNEFTLAPVPDTPGTAAAPTPDHLAASTYARTARALGHAPLPVAVTGTDVVPRARGLGSSSTCIVAGVLAAAALHEHRLPPDEVVALATAIEGHPDNVAPAILGGITASVLDAAGRPRTARIEPALELPFLALVPDHELSTAAARAAIPAQVPHVDATFTAARAALLVAALTAGQTGLLAEALRDRLHQPQRAHLIPGVEAILSAASDAGAWGGYVSGAGPTVMLIGPRDQAALAAAMAQHLADHPWPWELRALTLRQTGAEVVDPAR